MFCWFVFRALVYKHETYSFIYWLTWERETPTCWPIYVFIGSFWYVPWCRIEPTELVCWDNTLSNWASWTWHDSSLKLKNTTSQLKEIIFCVTFSGNTRLMDVDTMSQRSSASGECSFWKNLTASGTFEENLDVAKGTLTSLPGRLGGCL